MCGNSNKTLAPDIRTLLPSAKWKESLVTRSQFPFLAPCHLSGLRLSVEPSVVQGRTWPRICGVSVLLGLAPVSAHAMMSNFLNI
ncbi:hypothetical protein BJY00DRAFT_44746 [Aspergillus carlsbadensis]|nr:hypothetical protein BJY00DRAFT_44746 [Aspergillus carlsbadensis]